MLDGKQQQQLPQLGIHQNPFPPQDSEYLGAPPHPGSDEEQKLVFTERKALHRVSLNMGIPRNLGLPWLSCVTSGKSPILSLSQFFHVLKW